MLGMHRYYFFFLRAQLPILEAAKLRAAGTPFRQSARTILLTTLVDDAFFAMIFSPPLLLMLPVPNGAENQSNSCF